MPVEDVLTKLRVAGFRARLESTPGALWRCRVREDDQSEWVSVRPAHPGFATPLEAANDADARVAAMMAARQAVAEGRVLAALDRAVYERRLDRRVDAGTGEVMWVVRMAGGTETEPAGSPRGAALKWLEASGGA